MSDSNSSLRKAASLCCKKIHIGAAILPKPLFEYDTIDVANIDVVKDDNSIRIDDNQHTIEPIKNATVSYPSQYPPLHSISDTNEIYPTKKLPMYAQVLIREFNSVVIEHHLKWSPLCHTLPGPINASSPSDRIGRYDFYHVDAMVDFALQHDMEVKGHTLIWHVTSPVEFLNTLDAKQLEEEMRRHIFTTMGHFRGRIHMWDVVNEALAPDGSLANNIFLRKIGPCYIEKAFRYAHEADPSAILIYNDNKVEGGVDGPNPQKAEGYYKLLQSLVKNKVPIHAAGMQSHFNAGGVGVNRVPSPFAVKQQIHRIGNLGLKVHFSEMDVRVSQLPLNLQNLAQRQIYHDIIAAALTEPAFDGVWLWGFTDRHTWVKNFYYDDSPLVLDEMYQKKEAYIGLLDALRTLNVSGIVGGGVNLNSDVDSENRPWGYKWITNDCEADKSQQTIAFGDERPDWVHESQNP